jgi:hypothetical protein
VGGLLSADALVINWRSFARKYVEIITNDKLTTRSGRCPEKKVVTLDISFQLVSCSFWKGNTTKNSEDLGHTFLAWEALRWRDKILFVRV